MGHFEYVMSDVGYSRGQSIVIPLHTTEESYVGNKDEEHGAAIHGLRRQTQLRGALQII